MRGITWDRWCTASGKIKLAPPICVALVTRYQDSEKAAGYGLWCDCPYFVLLLRWLISSTQRVTR
jgi:hypothetical protein